MKLTDKAAYRLLFNQVQDFNNTAVLIESAIKSLGLQHDSQATIASMSQKQTETWASMKSVSHFNLGAALELMLKLILAITGTEIPRVHTLHELYCTLPPEWQKRLMRQYQSLDEKHTLLLISFKRSDTQPEAPENRDIGNLRTMLNYFDADVMLVHKRYSWDHMEKGTWLHFLNDITLFSKLIKRVMMQISRTPLT